MGMLDRFGRIADTYMNEKDRLIEADPERRRVFVGHSVWPTEILRDSIILASMVAVIAFYSWIIPPPLHSAADPFAQAGFVSLIGMFYSLTDICAGASICPNTLFPLDLLVNSLDPLLLHGMLVGGGQH